MARILIAVDFSSCGHAALTAGVQLARDLQADVRLVHAFPESTSPIAAGMGYHEVFRKFASEHETDEAIRLTTEFADEARAAGLDVDLVARAARPADLILEAAGDDEVTMLVMGTQGKSAVRRFILGSVAQDVIAKADKPVLVVPCP